MLQVEIHPLSAERVADYFRFFDDVAFADHPEWSWCYCTFFHMDEADEKSGDIQGKEDLRNLAHRLIEAGTLRGYLAYHAGEVVGWCNANDKQAFKRLKGEEALWAQEDPARIKAVTCFTIAPAHRRQGIARQLLARAVADAAQEGYPMVEVYPAHAAPDAYDHYHGHASMYEACGFETVRQTPYGAVMHRAIAYEKD